MPDAVKRHSSSVISPPFFPPFSCVQVGVLKQEVLELNQQLRRQNVPPEYLKEVVVRYILSTPVSEAVSY